MLEGVAALVAVGVESWLKSFFVCFLILRISFFFFFLASRGSGFFFFSLPFFFLSSSPSFSSLPARHSLAEAAHSSSPYVRYH